MRRDKPIGQVHNIWRIKDAFHCGVPYKEVTIGSGIFMVSTQAKPRRCSICNVDVIEGGRKGGGKPCLFDYQKFSQGHITVHTSSLLHKWALKKHNNSSPISSCPGCAAGELLMRWKILRGKDGRKYTVQYCLQCKWSQTIAKARIDDLVPFEKIIESSTNPTESIFMWKDDIDIVNN